MEFRFARQNDIPLLLPMMQDFYVFEQIPFVEDKAQSLLKLLISNDRFGRLILFETDGALAGYMVLTFGFSIEFGGRDALVDEFYIRPESRSSGIGAKALDFAEATCRSEGISALHLEADHFNTRAHEFYLRKGFKDHQRHLMTKWL